MEGERTYVLPCLEGLAPAIACRKVTQPATGATILFI